MITGDTTAQAIYLQTLAGVGQSYANKAAFQGATWDLTWTDTSGVALTTQPTWTIAHESGSVNGKHIVTYTIPVGVSLVKPTIPATMIDPGSWSNEGEAYDDDMIAGLLLSTAGVPSPSNAVDLDLGDVVMGDSWNTGTRYIPLGKLTALGYVFADLASGWTISAAFKDVPATTAVAATAVFGASVATDGAFSLGWISFPAGLNLTSTETEKQFFLDVQLKRTASSTIITSNRYALRVVWQRDTTA